MLDYMDEVLALQEQGMVFIAAWDYKHLISI